MAVSLARLIMVGMANSREPATQGFYALTRWSVWHGASIGSRELRYLLVAELVRARRPMTITELTDAIESAGFVVRCATNKAISDALRWEKAKGRVRSVSRGVYEIGEMPRSTKSWIVGRARRHRQLVAGDTTTAKRAA